MNFLIKTLALSILTHVAFASIPLAPRMGAGGKIDMFGCMHTNDYYIANFAAYQIDPNAPKQTNPIIEPLCQEIPKIGDTKITVDMLDRDVRHKSVTVKVFDADKKLVATLPTVVAKQGYISGNVNFPAPGYYDLSVSVDDPDLNTPSDTSALHIPLTVALFVPAPSASMGSVFGILFGVAAFAIGLGVLIPRLLKPQSTETVVNKIS